MMNQLPPKHPQMHNRDKRFRNNGRGGVGMVNIGNTCYMNAALQCLSHSRPFQKWFRKCYKHRVTAGNNNPSESVPLKLVRELKGILDYCWRDSPTAKPFEPVSFWRLLGQHNPMFQGYQQHDSQEFLRMLLDVVHEEMKRKYPTDPAKFAAENYDIGSTYPIAQDSDAGTYERNYRRDVLQSPSKRDVLPIHGLFRETDADANDACPWVESSIVSEVFGGTIRSTVTCLSCKNKSCKTEAVFDVSVPIPIDPVTAVSDGAGGDRDGDTSIGFSASAEGSRRSSTGKDPANMMQAAGNFFRSFGSKVSGLLYEKSVSLDDCMRKYCEPESLAGKDRYDCEKCKTKTDGEKVLRIQHLPEILVVHLKRFRYEAGWMGQKNSKPVSFPLEGLDMKPFLDPSALRNCGQTQYRLIGIIQHSGNMGAGHYIAFCRHAKDGMWVEFDDARVNTLSDADILKTEPYILFYQRMSDSTSIPGQIDMRAEAQASYKQIMEMIYGQLGEHSSFSTLAEIFQDPSRLPNSRNGPVCFINRRWFVRFRTSSNPGPIDNFQYLSSHGGVGCRRAEDLVTKFLPISEALYNKLQSKYGGGPKLNRVAVCEKSLIYLDSYNWRKKAELTLITKYDTKDTGEGKYWYLVDADWVSKWKRYVRDGDVEDIEDMICPFKITNYRLFERPTKRTAEIRPRRNLSVKKDFMGVNARVWALFAHLHGVLNVYPDDETPVCKKGLFMDSDDGVPETNLIPEEILNIEDNFEAQKLTWQFVDVYHGDLDAYQKANVFPRPQEGAGNGSPKKHRGEP